MPSIKYLVRGRRNPSKITCRFIIDGKTDFKRTLPLVINPAYFNNSTGKVRQLAGFKDKDNLALKLKDLSNQLGKCYNDAVSNGVPITSDWFKVAINDFFGLIEHTDLDYLSNYIAHFIHQLQYKVNRKTKKRGVSEGSRKSYVTVQNKIADFEAYTRKQYLVKDVDVWLANKFTDYLRDVQKLSENTTGKYVKLLKSFCLDAKKNGFEVAHNLHDIKGFSDDVKNIYLNWRDIKKLEGFTSDDKELIAARDWLLIGCGIGQRAGDLLALTKQNIVVNEGTTFIELTQQKTQSEVIVWVDDDVYKVLERNGIDFPPSFSPLPSSNLTLFNKKIKVVCRLSGINEQTEGARMNPKTNRKENGVFPKHKLVTSHICRRSFATNRYGIVPTEYIMNATGHKTETEFLKYIKRKPLDKARQMAMFKEQLQAEKERVLKPNLRAVN